MGDRFTKPPKRAAILLIDAGLLAVFLAAFLLYRAGAAPAAPAPAPTAAPLSAPAEAAPAAEKGPCAEAAPAEEKGSPISRGDAETGDFSATFPHEDTGDGASYTYQTEQFRIAIQEIPVDNAVVFVADVYVRNIRSIKTAFSNRGFGTTSSAYQFMVDLCQQQNAIFAVSGDFCSVRNDGVIIRNGLLLRRRYSPDLCILYQDGVMRTIQRRELQPEEIINGKPVWQTWSFGPPLLDGEGKAMEIKHLLMNKNPRCAIGYYAPGHYCFVVVDGRQKYYSEGMTLTELSAFMERLGCLAAYNLDGGSTAQMALGNMIISQPCNDGRRVGDIIYIEGLDGESEE